MTASPLRLAELIASLSLAMDLGVGQPMEWVIRCTLFGVRLAEVAGLSEVEQREVYYLSLLRHIGCTAVASTLAEMFGDDLTGGGVFALDPHNPTQVMSFLLRTAGKSQPPLRRARTVAGALATGPEKTRTVRAVQCEIAGQMAGTFGLDPHLQSLVNQLFERWDGKGFPKRLKGAALARPVRVIQLAQDVVSIQMAVGLETASRTIGERSGGLYDPDIVATCLSHGNELFASLETASLWTTLLEAEPGKPIVLVEGQLDQALEAVADFADMKSSFTLGHSRNVSGLADRAAQVFGMPQADSVTIRHAGLLHDLGRVAVSAPIWNKPGALSESEWERVRSHSYYTERILAHSEVLQPLGALASQHHERLDGSGYHHHLTAAGLPPAARLLAAADAYCAMTEERPHRPALPAEAAADQLRVETRAGRLDGDAVHATLSAAGHSVPTTRRSKPIADLTRREIEVLRLLARGLSNRQIAAQLSISVYTAGHHVQHIYDKTGVATRAGATLFALQNQLLD